MTTTYYVYCNAHDEPATHEIDDNVSLDDACDTILAAMKIDPASCEYDCVSDHIQIVYAHREMYVISDNALSTMMLDDIYH